jgi:phospholipase C
MIKKGSVIYLLLLAALLAGCLTATPIAPAGWSPPSATRNPVAAATSTPAVSTPPSATRNPVATATSTPAALTSGSASSDLATLRAKIKHIVVIMQENRSFDHYFGTYPGADGIPMQNGVPTVCVLDPKTKECVKPYHDPKDVNAGGPHAASSATADIDGRKMDGFIATFRNAQKACKNPDTPGCVSGETPDVMGWHDAREIPNYWTYAQNFVLQDHMFEPNASWSLPAHLFMVSAWSAKCSKPGDPMSCVNALDGPPGFVKPANLGKNDYAWTDLTYLLHKANVSWAYYLSEGNEPDCEDDAMLCPTKSQKQNVPGIWNPLPAFDTVKQDNQLANIQTVDKYFTAAKNGTLPAVSWIVPENKVSEHPPAKVSDGQAYVTSLVNAAMQGPDWNSTAIFISWDDWGGFYDHVVPPKVDENGYGLRVPGLVISPYAKKGYIDHQTLSFDAYLKLVEDDFLNGQRIDPKTDGRPDPRPDVRENAPQLGNLIEDFDFTQSPRPPLVLPTEPKPGPASIAPGAEALQPSFFAMTTVDPADYPKLTFGTLAHPEIGAWAWIERSKGSYDFTLFDKYVSDAMAHGLVDSTNTVSLAITLGSTPPWAAADPRSCATVRGVARCTSGPANIQDWSNFITAVMNHYNGVTEPHVRYYELWNEVNINLFWTGTQTDMLNLAKAAYPIIHADPHSMLLTPSVAGPVGNRAKTSGTTWMAGYLDAGGAQYADGGAFHGYIGEQKGVTPFPMPEEDSTSGCTKFTTCYGSIVTKATLMRQVFDQHGLAGKPMFDTEGSWGNGTVTDPDTQAAWLARWYLLQVGLRSTDNLQMAAWFTWGDPSTFHWGTIETDAGAPTQAGIAFNQVYSWLVGAAINQPCSSAADGTWTCSLTRPDGYRALAVWNTQGSKSYTPSAAYVDYRDLAGNTVKITQGAPITIVAKPILLETLPSTEGSP